MAKSNLDRQHHPRPSGVHRLTTATQADQLGQSSRISVAEFRRADAAGLVRLPGQGKGSGGRRTSRRRTSAMLADGTPSEEEIQRTCVEWSEKVISTYPALAWLMHTPNGGKRSKGEAGKMKAMGVKPGYPDLTIPVRNRFWTGLAVEMKSSTGQLTMDQKKWLVTLSESGWLTVVARSLEEFVDAVIAYHTGAIGIHVTRYPPRAARR